MRERFWVLGCMYIRARRILDFEPYFQYQVWRVRSCHSRTGTSSYEASYMRHVCDMPNNVLMWGPGQRTPTARPSLTPIPADCLILVTNTNSRHLPRYVRPPNFELFLKINDDKDRKCNMSFVQIVNYCKEFCKVRSFVRRGYELVWVTEIDVYERGS